MPRRPFAQLAFACALLAPAAAAQAQRPAATVEASEDAIVFEGRIDATSAAEFLRLLDGNFQLRRLVITSGGGSVSAALDMAQAIHARQLDVQVPSICLSSCANYIFPAARRKAIARPEAVGWHGNMAHVLYLQQTGQAAWSEPAMAQARDLARREHEFFSRIGVNGDVCWFAKLPPYGVEDFYALSIDDMRGFGIRDVTLLSSAPPAPPRGDVRRVEVDRAALQVPAEAGSGR